MLRRYLHLFTLNIDCKTPVSLSSRRGALFDNLGLLPASLGPGKRQPGPHGGKGLNGLQALPRLGDDTEGVDAAVILASRSSRIS